VRDRERLMAHPRRVVLLCGGASDEHDVSLASARSVIEAVGDRVALTPIVLDRRGGVLPPHEGRLALGLPATSANGAPVALAAGSAAGPGPDGLALALEASDIVFPLLHGPYGEDGSVQGLLKVMGVAFVGSGVLASAVGMDKLTMKAVFAAHGLPQVEHRGVRATAWQRDRTAALADLAVLPYPRFVKPANLGSSIGISRVDDEEALISAVEEALRYDRRVIVEAAVDGARELEVAVLGNDDPEVSPVGEIRYDAPFYDYVTKYTAGRAQLDIPAGVPAGVSARARDLARRAFAAIDGAGLARVDLFYDEPADALYVNEINTMPGFTATSMYPKLWEAAGVPYRELIERLLRLATEPR
jgi:D-alanine-D-alanine ligase